MAILTIVITRNIALSTFGRALFAIRSDEIAAEAMGINTTRNKVMAFVISAALAGVAGGLSGQLFANPLNPQNLNFVKSIEVIVMIVLGGIGSITGAVLGATILTILPEALRTFDQQFPGLADGDLRAAADSSDDFPASGPARPPRVHVGLAAPVEAEAGLARGSHYEKRQMGSDPILRTRDVTMRFGGLTAVKSLNMTVPRQSLYGLIGPNGAGKTTVFNVLTGVYCPTEGRDRVRRHAHREEEAVRDHQARRGADVSEHPFVCRHDGAARTS